MEYVDDSKEIVTRLRATIADSMKQDFHSGSATFNVRLRVRQRQILTSRSQVFSMYTFTLCQVTHHWRNAKFWRRD